MSWNLPLRADQPIAVDDVVAVLSEACGVPIEVMGSFPLRQEWGWPGSLIPQVGVDVLLPEGNVLRLHGALSTRGEDAAALIVARGLRELGYQIEVGEAEW